MSTDNDSDDQERDPKDAERLRDKVLKRMLETPPKPHGKEGENAPRNNG